MNTVVNHCVDARGLACPMPLLKAKQALAGVQAGDLVEVLATDPGSERDFKVFIELASHELLEFSTTDGVYRYLIKK